MQRWRAQGQRWGAQGQSQERQRAQGHSQETQEGTMAETHPRTFACAASPAPPRPLGSPRLPASQNPALTPEQVPWEDMVPSARKASPEDVLVVQEVS